MQRNTQSHSGNHDGLRRAPLLERLLRMLARLVEGKSAETSRNNDDVFTAEERGESPQPDGPLLPSRVDLQAVEHLLADLHKRGIKASVGKIQMVHVGTIRDAFGDNWDRFAGRAMEIAEGVLCQHLDPSDIYSRYENFAFIALDNRVAQVRGNTAHQ